MTSLPVMSCNCSTCQSMCEHFPCRGTVAEIEKLIEQGFGFRLMLYEYDDEDATFDCDRRVRMLMPAVREKESRVVHTATYEGAKPCTFFNASRLCDLHEAGLKPVEGKTADCSKQYDAFYYIKYVALKNALIRDWQSERGVKLIERWKSEFQKSSLIAVI